VSHDALNAEFNSFHLGFDVYDTSLIPAEKIELRELQGNRPTGGQERPSSRQLVDVALRALQVERDEPLFMWIHFLDPHEPYLAHEEFPFGELPIDLYDSEVAFTDQQIGRLLGQLEERGRLDRTIVVLTSDHGEEFQDHGGIGHAKTLYEELIRVPLIVHVPGFTPTRVPQAVSHLDVAPTVLALAGVPVPEAFTGRVLPATATGFEPQPSRPIFAHTQRKASKRSVLHENWKLIVDRRAGSEQLFQIAEDPQELHDRSNSHPEVRDALKITLENARTSGSAKAQTIELSAEQKMRLEALGYTQSEDDGDPNE
jgi:arylsulfatase A-like enzyme